MRHILNEIDWMSIKLLGATIVFGLTLGETVMILAGLSTIIYNVIRSRKELKK